MSAEPRTKTERRILQALYRLQTHGDLDCGRLGTYETLMHETLCSRPGLLRTCQQMVQEGKLVRKKINAADRRRWKRQWPDGHAQRQAHFTLSPEMMKLMEVEYDMQEWLEEDHRQQVAGRRAKRLLLGPDGDYSISYHDNDRRDENANLEGLPSSSEEFQGMKAYDSTHGWVDEDPGKKVAARKTERISLDANDEDSDSVGHEDRVDALLDFSDLPG